MVDCRRGDHREGVMRLLLLIAVVAILVLAARSMINRK
jgi:hypothetical protein